jgi:hypothetical protein
MPRTKLVTCLVRFLEPFRTVLLPRQTVQQLVSYSLFSRCQPQSETPKGTLHTKLVTCLVRILEPFQTILVPR